MTSVELQKANLEAQKGDGGSPNGSGQGSSGGQNNSQGGGSNSSSVGGALPPLAKLLTNPILTSLSALGNLGGLNDLLSAASLPHGSPPVQTTGVHRRPHNSSFTPKLKASGSPPPKPKNERNKFAPY
ncbi:unnamed protein product [Allacma fusca]|uniref:Uncharacterized protein n=1 Tax=Allacma fusca TaxID=39272 RepID=A0A8J2L2Z8_9HEXA|nr:unnamed protein product [Allacma fusca]